MKKESGTVIYSPSDLIRYLVSLFAFSAFCAMLLAPCCFDSGPVIRGPVVMWSQSPSYCGSKECTYRSRTSKSLELARRSCTTRNSVTHRFATMTNARLFSDDERLHGNGGQTKAARRLRSKRNARISGNAATIWSNRHAIRHRPAATPGRVSRV
jgi:hypothetical protein